MFPISASEAIVGKHYKKNTKFAPAEDEMRFPLERFVIQGRQPINLIGRQGRAIESPSTEREGPSNTKRQTRSIKAPSTKSPVIESHD